MILISEKIKKIAQNIFQEVKVTENITSKNKALEIVKKIYPGEKIDIEPMSEEGLAYYLNYKDKRYLVASYNFKEKKLWHREPKKYVFRKLAQYFDIDPEMLLKLLQDYLQETQEDWNYILPTELNKLIESGKASEFFLLDVRRPEDFAEGHIPGAQNIFWLDILKKENLKKLPIDKDIIIYCYVGHTSSQVMVLLNLLGYRCKSLKFGLGISPSEGVPVAGWTDYNYFLKKRIK